MARLIATAVVILVVVGVVLAATGVLRFHNTEDETGVTLDKKELKAKTQEAVDTTEKAGGKLLEKTGDTLHKAAERMRGSPGDRSGPPAAPAGDDTSTRRPNAINTPPENSEDQSDQ